MEKSEVVINLHEADKKVIEAGARTAGTDVKTFMICAALRRARQEGETERVLCFEGRLGNLSA